MHLNSASCTQESQHEYSPCIPFEAVETECFTCPLIDLTRLPCHVVRHNPCLSSDSAQIGIHTHTYTYTPSKHNFSCVVDSPMMFVNCTCPLPSFVGGLLLMTHSC